MKKNLLFILHLSIIVLVPSWLHGINNLLTTDLKKAATALQWYGKTMGNCLVNVSSSAKKAVLQATKEAYCCLNDFAQTIEAEEVISKTLAGSARIANPYYWTVSLTNGTPHILRPWQELCRIIDNTNWLYLDQHKKRVEIIFHSFELQLNNYHESFPDRKTILDALKLRAENRINELKKESLTHQSPTLKSVAKIGSWAFLASLSGFATYDTIQSKDHYGWQGTAAILGLLTSLSVSNCAYSLNSLLNSKKYNQEFLRLNQAILEKLNLVQLAESSPTVIS